MDQQSQGVWKVTFSLLRNAVKTVKRGGMRLIAAVFIMQLVVLVVALPVIRWIFTEALHASGMTGVDVSALTIGPGFPLTATLILLIVLLAFWLLAIQFAILSVLIARSSTGQSLSFKPVFKDLKPLVNKIFKPSSSALLFYLFIVIPVTGFGFASLLVERIAIPAFVTGELYKSTSGTIFMVIYLLTLGVLNTRWSLTTPIFTLTRATGGQSLRSSWKLTTGLGGIQIPLAVASIMLGAALATVVLVGLTLLPVWIADNIAPTAAPVVASIGLGVAEVLGGLLTSLVIALIMAVLFSYLQLHKDSLPKNRQLQSLEHDDAKQSQKTEPKNKKRRAPTLTFSIALVALTALLATVSYGPINDLAQKPQSLVLGHRGFSEGGVENTIGGLEAAAEAGADLVEMDVMQTIDGKFVVMHDVNLNRLAGQNVDVKSLTLAELTKITVKDQQGHTDLIPSLADYVNRAAELDMPLLIEIKLSGAETPNHVDELVTELESLDALDSHIYHSLDPASVARLKRIRPNLNVGYTMAFAGVEVPDTPADFIVVEAWTATEKMQKEAYAAGLGFMVWTVNDVPTMREHLRRGTDGIITDHPDLTIKARKEMQRERGLAGVMWDMLDRFVTVF
ncbi:MAG TPA: glycerophosphoryl diester phosphodiesterase membrane domain-containing protein [Microbacteriaceae bacterium]|nr:glycerophosphoryl diester phosphodiesterase membrane domain-containing protein [Microbacteriaceae bacterium]